MKSNQPQAIHLKDYLQPDFFVEKIDLSFDLFEDKAIVKNTMHLNRNQLGGKHQRALMLYGEELNLLSLSVDNVALTTAQYQVNDKSLTLTQVPDSFVLEIQTQIHPQKNTTLSGLYKSDGLFCTQCEAEGFRRITYYLDRPDVMAPFSTTIKADKSKYPVLLSNGNLVNKGDDGDRHWVTWQDPFKKPAYLFALVAGDLAIKEDTYTTGSGREIKLAIFVEKENIDKCQYAMDALKHSMQWDEEKYGREYDLDIYMIVAVNDFNMGAMENKGLNIFNAKYVLANTQTATDADFMGVEMVVGHEYFHNWTGNRVTLRDWFQLSLKEGLTVFREQQFSQDMGSSVVKRIEDVKSIRTRQFAEDSGPIAHPVRPASYIEINNFYTMTIYYKGSEVIRMLHTLLGQQKFRKGMDLYFERHDGEAVTIEHFVHAMQDANPDATHIDFNQFMLWYTQAGTPVVEVMQTQSKQAGTIIFDFKQTCPDTPNQPNKKPFLIPIKINCFESNGQKIDLSDNPQIHHTEAGHYFILSSEKASLEIKTNADKLIPSLLGHFSAPVKLEYPYTEDELSLLVQDDDDGFNRWDKAQELNCLTIKNLLKNPGNQIKLPDVYKTLYKSLLAKRDLEPSLLAQLMSLPSFYYVAEDLPKVDSGALNTVITQLRYVIADTFKTEIESLYQFAVKQDQGEFDAQSIGFRALKNTCLSLLGRTQDESFVPLIDKQFKQARNMTDKMGALWSINNWQHPLRKTLFDQFYEQFQDEQLVVDKWFALQAQSDLPDTLSNVKNLMQHKAFDFKNPNNIYALIRTFGANNAIGFHAPDGSGYEFIADQVIALNQQNPQVAARVLEPLTQWQRFDMKQSQLMNAALIRIKAQEKLSEDVYEIVSKSCE